MADNELLLERNGPVARWSLNRPEAMNALNSALVACFEAAMDAAESDDGVRAIVITASGPVFCAGADLKEAMADPPAGGGGDFLERASAMMNRLRRFPKPVIAALNGTTMAGGLELAMCADIIIAADGIKIADAHANFGVFPGAGGAAVLPTLIPSPSAMYMLLTGRSLPAQRLYDLGLIAELHPADALAGAAQVLAEHIASKSPGALRRMKAVARSAADKTAEEALSHESRLLREHLASDDMREGLQAFAEKRAPVFTGR